MPHIGLLLSGLQVTVFKNYIHIQFHFNVVRTGNLVNSAQDSTALWLWYSLLNTTDRRLPPIKKTDKNLKKQTTRERDMAVLVSGCLPVSTHYPGFPPKKVGQPDDRKEFSVQRWIYCLVTLQKREELVSLSVVHQNSKTNNFSNFTNFEMNCGSELYLTNALLPPVYFTLQCTAVILKMYIVNNNQYSRGCLSQDKD